MRGSGGIVWNWENSLIYGKTWASGRSALCVPKSPSHPQHPRGGDESPVFPSRHPAVFSKRGKLSRDTEGKDRVL